MANNEWDDFDDDSQDDGSEGLPKKLRQQIKAQAKRIAELEAERADLTKKTRQTAVKEILNGAGVTPKIARFVLADVDDPTPEAVTEWLKDNAEIFGIELNGNPEAPVGVPQGMSPEDVQNLAAINQFVDTTTPAAPKGPQAAIEQQINAAQSPEELAKLLGIGQVQAF